MNRPNATDEKYLYGYDVMSYQKDLELYCDELEKQMEKETKYRQDEFVRLNKRAEMFEQRHLLTIEDKMKLWNKNEKLEKALEKACSTLEQNHAEFVTIKYKCKRNATSEEWKEWCMNDD